MIKVEFDCTFYEDNPQNPYWHYYEVRSLIPNLISSIKEINNDLQYKKFASVDEAIEFCKPICSNLLKKYSELNFCDITYEDGYTPYNNCIFSAITKAGYNDGDGISALIARLA